MSNPMKSLALTLLLASSSVISATKIQDQIGATSLNNIRHSRGQIGSTEIDFSNIDWATVTLNDFPTITLIEDDL